MTEWNEETRKWLEEESMEWVAYETKAVAAVTAALEEIERLEERIDNLLVYNNAELERRLAAERRGRELEEQNERLLSEQR